LPQFFSFQLAKSKYLPRKCLASPSMSQFSLQVPPCSCVAQLSR
jgi:hypothetical protein